MLSEALVSSYTHCSGHAKASGRLSQPAVHLRQEADGDVSSILINTSIFTRAILSLIRLPGPMIYLSPPRS